MFEILQKNWLEINLDELSEFILKVKKFSNNKNANSPSIRRNILKEIKKAPAKNILLAKKENELIGCLSYVIHTDSKVMQILDWHPLIASIEEKEIIADALLLKSLAIAKQEKMDFISIEFIDILDKKESNFSYYYQLYTRNNFTKFTEDSFYQLDLLNFLKKKKPLPEGFELQYLSNVDNTDVYKCWHETFEKGVDRFFLDLSEAARKKHFENNWNQKIPLIKEASFILLKDKEIIGFTRVLNHGHKIGYLSPFGIHPLYRGKGLAEILLLESIHALIANKYNTLTLYVDVNNIAAIKLYEKIDFKFKNRVLTLYQSI